MEAFAIFDPVAGDLTVSGQDGRPILQVPAKIAFARAYREDGVLILRVEGEAAALAFVDPELRPCPLRLEAAEDGWWQVVPGRPDGAETQAPCPV